jgi:hypothetical protein
MHRKWEINKSMVQIGARDKKEVMAESIDGVKDRLVEKKAGIPIFFGCEWAQMNAAFNWGRADLFNRAFCCCIISVGLRGDKHRIYFELQPQSEPVLSAKRLYAKQFLESIDE